MKLSDDEEQFRLNLFSPICHKQAKAACKVDLTADKCDDKEFDDVPNNADSHEVVDDGGNDNRIGIGRDGGGEEDKGVDDDDTATQKASDSVLSADGGD